MRGSKSVVEKLDQDFKKFIITKVPETVHMPVVDGFLWFLA
jgi:hypothetical protein